MQVSSVAQAPLVRAKRTHSCTRLVRALIVAGRVPLSLFPLRDLGKASGIS